MAIIGIDLGTTNSLVALWRDGKSVLIPSASASGSVLTPSVVSIDADGTLLVGEVAKECLLTKPEQTMCEFKRFMGTQKQYAIGGKQYAPEELSAMVLKKLKQDAEAYLNESVTEAVISVPAYFNDDQRAATKRAGALAGLKVERLVNEPSAAALACQALYPQESALYLVVDFGGGTLDVSLVECFETVINVLAISGDNHLGGMDFDRAIAKHYCRERGLFFGELSLQRQRLLLHSAEAVKFALTDAEQADLLVATDSGQDRLPLSRRALIALAAPEFERFLKPIHRVLADGETDINEVDQIVLVGGSCKMPVVSLYLQHVLGKRPVMIGSPDTVVAQGVGVYAAIKERRKEIKEMVLTDICPFSLGVGMHNEADLNRPLMSAILERNTPLPSSRERTYVTTHDQQKSVNVHIYQGEEYYAKDNLLLGELSVAVPPAPAEQEAIAVRFTYDMDGLLDVVVRAISTGEERQALVRRENLTMTEEEICKKQKALEALKILPRDREENRVLVEKAMAYHVQAMGGMKEFLSCELTVFLKEIETNSAIKAAKARERMCKVLLRAQSYLECGQNLQELVSDNWYDAVLAAHEYTGEDEDEAGGRPDDRESWREGEKGRIH